MRLVIREAGRSAIKSRRPRSGSPLLACLLALAMVSVPASARADWSAPEEISDADTRNASNLDADASDLGVFAAAWSYGQNDVASVVDPGVGSAGAPQQHVGDYGRPTIGVGGGNVGALSFASTLTGSNYGIFAAAKPGDAAQFGAASQIQGPTTESATGNPVLDVNDAGTAQLFHDVGNYQYCCVHQLVGRVLSTPSTNTWTAGGSFSSAQSETHNRAVAAGPDGSTVMLFKTNNGTNFRTIEPAVVENDGSASKGASIAASSGNGAGVLTNPSGISVDRMPDSSVVAAFERYAGTGGGIFVADFAKARAAGGAGGDVGAVRRSDDEDGSRPVVETDAAGNTLLTWYDPSDGGEDPAALRAKYRPAGGSFGDAETIAQGANVTPAYDMAMDAAGNAHVAYVNAGGRVEASWRAAGGSAWTEGETLGAGITESEDPRVVTGREGEAFATWTADPAADNQERVYRSTFSPPEPDETPPDGKVRPIGTNKAGKPTRLRLVSSEDGSAVAKGLQRQTSRGKIKVALKPVRVNLDARSGQAVTLKPKGASNARKARKLSKAVRRRGAKAKATITAVFADEAGNRGRERLTLKLR